MNTFLRQRILDQPPTPHTPVTLKSALLTFTPEQRPGCDLPHQHGDTRRDHDEKHASQPSSTSSRQIVRPRETEYASCSSSRALTSNILAQPRRIDSISCGTIRC